MALERPPRSTPISQYAPPRAGSTKRLRAFEPRRASSATWVVRSTPGALPSIGSDDEEDFSSTIVGLGASLGLALDARLATPLVEELAPPSRAPTVIPHAVFFGEVLDEAMAL